MKQTSVEFYAIETGKLEIERAKGLLTFSQMFDKMLGILNEAKAMEKEQRINDIHFGHGISSNVNINYEAYFKLEKGNK